MAIRSFLAYLFFLLLGIASVIAGVAILVTGAELRFATSSEAFVVTYIPYVFILAGLLAASLLFWQHRAG